MARRPRRPRLDCWFSWLHKVKGRHVMRRVGKQPVDDFCRAHAAIDSFESRARIINARLDLPFPTLSVLHLIDQLRDAESKAKTLVEKKEIGDNDYGFKLLETNGVTTEEDYDAALPIQGQYTKNVEGLKHYRINGYTTYYVKDTPLLEHHKGPKGWDDPIDEIATNGPVYAWLQPSKSFINSTYEIYRTPKKPALGDMLMRLHAVCLFGMGSRGRKLSVFAHQNNWGPGQHIRGRGLLHSEVLIGVIVPDVQKNWD